MNTPRSASDVNRSAYDRIAPRFAQVNAVMPGELVERAGRLLERLSSSPARILDLGCGTGRDLAWFIYHKAAAFGADLSWGMLDQARKPSSAPLCQIDMRFLAYASASFQAIWCCAALLHLPKSEAPRALAEMARVLGPGGLLTLSVQKGSGEGIERISSDDDVERFFARYEPEEMAILIENAGFVILDRGENLSGRHWLWFEAQRKRITP